MCHGMITMVCKYFTSLFVCLLYFELKYLYITYLPSGHSTYRLSRDTSTSCGANMDGCVMLRRWLRFESCIQILLLW